MKKQFIFNIDSELFSNFPNAKIGALVVSKLVAKKDFSEAEFKNAQENLMDKIFTNNKNLFEQPNIVNWKTSWEKIGLNIKKHTPSHLSLQKRFTKDKYLTRINDIVDIYNLISLSYTIPVGGHDIEDLNEIIISKTTGIEEYQPLDSKDKEKVSENEWAYMSEKTILTRNLVWRQSEISKIKDNTKSILFPFDDLVGNFTHQQLYNIITDLLKFLGVYYQFDYEFAIADRYNPKCLFNNPLAYEQSTDTHPLLIRPKIDTSSDKIDNFFDRKLDIIYPSKEEFKKALLSGRRLSFYIGADATAPDLHIGHLLPILKMAELQEMGHRIIFLIGDFTAQIGDPTDKSATRVKLSEEQVAKNAQNFKEQIEKYIDFKSKTNPAEIVFNSHWNAGLKFSNILELSSNFTVQQMIERDMFKTRLNNNKPIYLHEFMYPLMQGYDSVVLEIDGEFGGRDQTFNMLAGRTLLKNYKGKDKFVITTHFLISSDGESKMSKSIGNCIFISDTPRNKYGKIMAIPDDLIVHYYEMLTKKSSEEIADISKSLEQPDNAMNIKKSLAFEIVEKLHNKEDARDAADFFAQTVQNSEIPIDAPEMTKEEISSKNNHKSTIDLKSLLVLCGLVQSGAEAKRLIKGGAVEINGNKVVTITENIDISELKSIKSGKRSWLRIT
jgi:tyrosyl-tRNA synthetase